MQQRRLCTFAHIWPQCAQNAHLLLNVGIPPSSREVVQSAGYGYRLSAQLLKREINRAGPALDMLLRYTQMLITQPAQTAACNWHHSVEQHRGAGADLRDASEPVATTSTAYAYWIMQPRI